jgi:hypothetical protein
MNQTGTGVWNVVVANIINKERLKVHCALPYSVYIDEFFPPLQIDVYINSALWVVRMVSGVLPHSATALVNNSVFASLY